MNNNKKSYEEFTLIELLVLYRLEVTELDPCDAEHETIVIEEWVHPVNWEQPMLRQYYPDLGCCVYKNVPPC